MSIVDNPNDKGSKKEPEKNPELSLDELAYDEPEEATPNVESKPSADDDLPEKYRGKSPAEIARMHQELEQRFGQQGNEVGELRRTLDTYIMSRLQEGQTKQQQDDDDDEDFFVDPKKSVSKAIAKDPEIQQLKEAARKAEQMAVQQTLKSKHPDYEQVLQDSKFQDWVKSSKLRQRLLVEADRNYDVDAADELFTEYKTTVAAKKASDDVIDAEKTQRKQEIKKASTGTAKGAPAARTSGKIYRRADIVELIRTNPRRYEALAADIRKAYEEGRVR